MNRLLRVLAVSSLSLAAAALPSAAQALPPSIIGSAESPAAGPAATTAAATTAKAVAAAPRAASSIPVVTSTTVTGATERTAHITLTGAAVGESAYALDEKSHVESSRVTVGASGSVTLDLVVPAGQYTLLTVFVISATAGDTPFVINTSVNDSTDATYAPEVTGLSLTKNPLVAHIRGAGFRPNSHIDVNQAGLASSASVTTDDAGRFRLDFAVPEPTDHLLIQFAHSAPSGAGQLFELLLDPGRYADAPPVGAPAAPTVSTSTVGSVTLLTVHGTAEASFVVRDASGKTRAGGILRLQGVEATAVATVLTPTAEQRFTVVQTVGSLESEPAEILLSPGAGSALSATRTVSAARTADSFALSVDASPRAVVRVTDATGTILGQRAATGAGHADLVVSAAVGDTVTITQLRDGATSAPERIAL